MSLRGARIKWRAMDIQLAQSIQHDLERRERYRDILRRIAQEDSNARVLLEALFAVARKSHKDGCLNHYGEFMLTVAERYELEKRF